MPSNTVDATILTNFGLTEEGVQYVIKAQDEGPSRRVGAHRAGNLVLDVPIHRLGVTLQAESLSGEYLFLVEQELNDGLIAIFDQPPPVPLRITDIRGRRTRVSYTPDFLVVDATGVSVKEIKPDAVLARLLESHPHDWHRDKNGYIYKPAKAIFASVGIRHEVLPTSSFNYVRAANYRMLAIAARAPLTSIDLRHEALARRIVTAERAIRIGEVLKRLERADITPILRLIHQHELFVDIDRVLLSDPTNAWIATNPIDAHSMQQSEQTIHRLVSSNAIVRDETICHPRHEVEFVRRLEVLNGTAAKVHARSLRTLQRYRKRVREAQGKVSALIPRWSRCGCREPRIGPTHRSFLSQHIRCHRRNPGNPSVRQAYGSYCDAIGELYRETGQTETPVCRSTYYKMWNEVRLRAYDAASKGGRRLRARISDSHDPGKRSLLATRPFEVAHIDHWKADIHIVVRDSPKVTKRPWLTAMVDSYSGEVLATWLGFRAPGKTACSMVVRDCVRRHGLLPEMIITDSGAEFRSVHFSAMLASFGITHAERPPEEPRFGKEVERLFGYFKERFVRGMPGFGLSIHESRAVSSGFQAAHRAALDLAELHRALKFFVDGYYNLSHKPGSLSSRVTLRNEGLAKFEHSGIRATWDQTFLIATSIEAPTAKYNLWPGKGVQVLGRWYSSQELLSFSGPKKLLTVRVEPYCAAVVYVHCGSAWFVCHCSESMRYSTMSDAELLTRTSEANDLKKLARKLAEEEDRTLGYALGLIQDEPPQEAKSSPPDGTNVIEEPRGIRYRFEDVRETDEESGEDES
ncbi:MAG TPA: DDE-type integrase/transposase/recombinase [Lysobacter sp.]